MTRGENVNASVINKIWWRILYHEKDIFNMFYNKYVFVYSKKHFIIKSKGKKMTGSM